MHYVLPIPACAVCTLSAWGIAAPRSLSTRMYLLWWWWKGMSAAVLCVTRNIILAIRKNVERHSPDKWVSVLWHCQWPQCIWIHAMVCNYDICVLVSVLVYASCSPYIPANIQSNASRPMNWIKGCLGVSPMNEFSNSGVKALPHRSTSSYVLLKINEANNSVDLLLSHVGIDAWPNHFGGALYSAVNTLYAFTCIYKVSVRYR